MQVNYKPWAIENENGGLWGVKLLDGNFAGAVISINSVKMEDDESGECSLDFNFIEKPPGRTEEELTSAEFNNTISYILNDILAKAIDEFENRDRDSFASHNG